MEQQKFHIGQIVNFVKPSKDGEQYLKRDDIKQGVDYEIESVNGDGKWIRFNKNRFWHHGEQFIPKNVSKYTKQYCKDNKVAIRVKSKDEFEKILTFTRGLGGRRYEYPGDGSTLNGNDGCFCRIDSNWYQKNGYDIIDFNQVNFTEMRKVTGYKVPFDIFKGKVKQGDIYTLQGNDENNPYRLQGSLDGALRLPSEIVEKWEAVYENTEVKIGEYTAERNGSRIKFGCQEFTRDELTLVHRLVTSGDLSGRVEIQGVRITQTMIENLIKMLN